MLYTLHILVLLTAHHTTLFSVQFPSHFTCEAAQGDVDENVVGAMAARQWHYKVKPVAAMTECVMNPTIAG